MTEKPQCTICKRHGNGVVFPMTGIKTEGFKFGDICDGCDELLSGFENDESDMNLVVLTGRIAAEPELTTFDSGAILMRLLLTTRVVEPRRRLDVLPVVMWDPPDDHVVLTLERSDRVWVAGMIQRRFWSAEVGRTSRVEIVAHDVQLQPVREEATSGVVR